MDKSLYIENHAKSPSLPFELIALSEAKNYQRWVFRTIEPFLGMRVLEVGAGIGNMSRWLTSVERLILTEQDPGLLEHLKQEVAQWCVLSQRERDVSATKYPEDLPENAQATNWDANPTKYQEHLWPEYLQDVNATKYNEKLSVQNFDILKDDVSVYVHENLDTIVSFNVLEHILDDKQALYRLSHILKQSKSSHPKHLVIFVPAHQWAYGSLDKTFGHFRRYSQKMIQNLAKEVCPEAQLYTQYFNIFGLVGWVLHGKILRRDAIGLQSIELFEKMCSYLIPIDNFLHTTLRLPLGQSLLAVLKWPS